MRIFTSLLVVCMLITTSCNSTKTGLFGSGKKNKEASVKGTSINKTLMPSTPIKEVEETLVTNNDKAPSPQKYFVIIGSFRDPANAREHQVIVRKDGFESEVLKNEAGLYRVSVKATDDITEARNEVRRIWAKFPKYSDTWMLIRK
jgi:cell division septation protein DedD